jgi:hypothetical protein
VKLYFEAQRAVCKSRARILYQTQTTYRTRNLHRNHPYETVHLPPSNAAHETKIPIDQEAFMTYVQFHTIPSRLSPMVTKGKSKRERDNEKRDIEKSGTPLPTPQPVPLPTQQPIFSGTTAARAHRFQQCNRSTRLRWSVLSTALVRVDRTPFVMRSDVVDKHV